MCVHKPRQSGFTLLEVMIAMLVFAILSAAGYRLLANFATIGERHAFQYEQNARLSQQLTVLLHDLRHAVATQGGLTDSQSGSQGWQEGSMHTGKDYLLEFSSLGYLPHKQSQTFSQTLRVQYRIQVDELSGRRELLRLSGPADPGAAAEALLRKQSLGEVEQLSMRFLDSKGRWHANWPVLDRAQKHAQPEQLPLAIELSINSTGGAVRRLVSILG